MYQKIKKIIGILLRKNLKKQYICQYLCIEIYIKITTVMYLPSFFVDLMDRVYHSYINLK